MPHHKNVPIRALEGKRIQAVYGHNWVAIPCKTVAPDSKHMLTFDLTAGRKTYLVLDPYGDERIPQEIRDRIFCPEPAFTIAIDRKDGRIYGAHAIREKKGLAVFLSPLCSYAGAPQHVVPAEWVAKLEEVKSQKRPFALTIDPVLLMHFIRQESSYQDLRMGIHVNLHFQEGALEVCPSRGSVDLPTPVYREVGYWC